MSTNTATLPDQELPWGGGRPDAEERIPHLVIAWSLEEPARLGESLPITGRGVLGRGGAMADDRAPRGVFQRQRPSGTVPTRPLGSARISRRQLDYRPVGDGKIEIVRSGRCAMLVNGVETERAVVEAGATITLRNAMVLLVVERSRALRKPRSFRGEQAIPFGAADPHGIVGESPSAWQLRDDLAFAASSGHHTLIRGESGVGKELGARAIHELSDRGARPLVSRNAATFPEGLVDAELFGTMKGYPNPTSPERPGLVGEANGSSLFLDEIGELAPHLQAHLLRLLDSGGEYQRLGEARLRRSDLRLIAATNRPLDALKHDFAARFTMRVEIPGLDRRREDIPLLIRHILDRIGRSHPDIAQRCFERRGGELAEPRLAPDLVEALLRHRFTHHFRELERLVWVALSSSHGSFIELTDEVRAELRIEDARSAPPQELGREEIERALAASGGSVGRAAQALGLKNRFALYRVMKKLGIAAQGDDDDEA